MTGYDVEVSEEAPPRSCCHDGDPRCIGLQHESAVADLIDNSIYAGARQIDVVLHGDGTDSWCGVADNGRGMTAGQLKQAMTIGSRDPHLPRDTADPGRFGFGLKTALFSQCRELTVGSHQANQSVAYRTWDLAYVRAEGRWLLLKSPPPRARELIEQCHRPGPGTVVLWRRLTGDLVEEGADIADRRAQQRFLQRVMSLERHLAMTFGRFLLREGGPADPPQRCSGWWLGSIPCRSPGDAAPPARRTSVPRRKGERFPGCRHRARARPSSTARTPSAPTVPVAARVERGEVELADRVEHKPREVVLGQPVAEAGGHQVLLVTIALQEALGRGGAPESLRPPPPCLTYRDATSRGRLCDSLCQ